MSEFDEKVPTLTLDPFKMAEKSQEVVEVKPEPKAVIDYEEEKLSSDEMKVVDAFVEQIDINNSNAILQYGAGAQKKVADFSDTALDSVKTKDLGEIGGMLTNMVVELKGFEIEETDKGFFSHFKKGANKITGLKAKYEKAEVNVNQVAKALENHQITLMKDVAMLDQLYDLNKNYFKELSMYIIAGKKKLNKVQTEDIPALRAKAEASQLQEDAQAVNDMAGMCNRFEKKIHDLELTRMICLQMGPQIRLVQGNDTLMSEKIQSTIVNTIPLWKSQMVLAMGVSHSQEAVRAEREVNDMTNRLLQKNAETLKMATIETAKESERGIIEIETLKKTNQALIETLDEVAKIQTEGREKRQAAEVELATMEAEMKKKLLNISQTTKA